MTIEQLLRKLYNGYAARFNNGVWSVFYIDHDMVYRARYIGILDVENGLITKFGPNPQASFMDVDTIQQALAGTR